MADKLKLHRCSWTFLHTEKDACWKVQKALDEQGIEYEIVKHGYGKGQKMRDGVKQVGGDGLLPVLELPGGEVYRAESDEMAARVRSGSLRAA
jgi:glutathione S-transferase